MLGASVETDRLGTAFVAGFTGTVADGSEATGM